MKGGFAEILDVTGSSIDNLALAISVNNFLETSSPYEEAFALYVALLDMCDGEHELVDEPLRSKLLREVQRVPHIVIAQKIRKHTLSIRKVLADSMAYSLCKQQEAMLEHIKGSSINVEDILSMLNESKFLMLEKR
jgi:hypothetical protein